MTVTTASSPEIIDFNNFGEIKFFTDGQAQDWMRRNGWFQLHSGDYFKLGTSPATMFMREGMFILQLRSLK